MTDTQPSLPQIPPTQYAPQPIPPPPPRKPAIRNYLLAIVAIILVASAFGIARNVLSHQPTVTTPTPDTLATANASSTASALENTQLTQWASTAAVEAMTPTAALPSPPVSGWVATHSFSGVGDKKTAIFSVPADWKIVWSCDARHNYGVNGAFYVSAYSSDGTILDANAAGGDCIANKVTSDSTEEHQAGQIYLDVLSSVPWTVQVQEFQ